MPIALDGHDVPCPQSTKPGRTCHIRVPEGQSSILAAEFIPWIDDDTGHLDDLTANNEHESNKPLGAIDR